MLLNPHGRRVQQLYTKRSSLDLYIQTYRHLQLRGMSSNSRDGKQAMIHLCLTSTSQAVAGTTEVNQSVPGCFIPLRRSMARQRRAHEADVVNPDASFSLHH